MRVVNSKELPDLIANHELSEEGLLWCYNGMDCLIPHDIESHLSGIDTDNSRLMYRFSRAQQGPALAMSLRGFRIDPWERERVRHGLEVRMKRIRHVIDELAKVVWYKPLNPLSPKQLMTFFYERMDIEPIYNFDHKTKRRVMTCDETALEKIRDTHFYAEPIARAILKYRELQGKLKVLKSKSDLDGRMRMSYNVAAAETGRWSSSKNVHGRGTNAQNITPEMRSIFIADDGMKMGNVDLEQAESRGVAYLAQDEDYIEACESGDLHTAVCKMVWPNFAWTGDWAKDKAMCDSSMFDAIHSHRFVAKTCGHATNYIAAARTLAILLKTTIAKMEEFQADYFGRFKRIPVWHQEVATQLQTKGYITTPLGRTRHFFGRRGSDETLREAVAYGPQSLIADILNIALMRIWTELEMKLNVIQILAQVHDSIVFQYPEDQEDFVVERCLELMQVPVTIHGRIMVIPAEMKVGYDWRNMKVYGTEASRKLQRRPLNPLEVSMH